MSVVGIAELSLPKAKRTGTEMVSLDDAAKWLGISRQAVGQWCMRPGAPTVLDSRGRRLPVWPDFARWREKELIKGAEERLRARLQPREPEPNTVGAYDLRRAQAEARLAEMKVEEKEGKLGPPDQYAAEVVRFCTRLGGTVRGMKSRHAADIIGITDHQQAVRALERIGDALLADLQAEARANAAAAA